ncbi:MAG: type II toxin-antitoxin system YafQ family toxin [Acidobacteriia bacterium]|nr:type II toxin-antitoxin system YafQ family toxin [Terriglobia bacterium]
MIDVHADQAGALVLPRDCFHGPSNHSRSIESGADFHDDQSPGCGLLQPRIEPILLLPIGSINEPVAATHVHKNRSAAVGTQRNQFRIGDLLRACVNARSDSVDYRLEWPRVGGARLQALIAGVATLWRVDALLGKARLGEHSFHVGGQDEVTLFANQLQQFRVRRVRCRFPSDRSNVLGKEAPFQRLGPVPISDEFVLHPKPTSDRVLPEKHRDHSLSGDWVGDRECRIKPDLLLIYRKPTADTVRLARLGSHSELFE